MVLTWTRHIALWLLRSGVGTLLLGLLGGLLGFLIAGHTNQPVWTVIALAFGLGVVGAIAFSVPNAPPASVGMTILVMRAITGMCLGLGLGLYAGALSAPHGLPPVWIIWTVPLASLLLAFSQAIGKWLRVGWSFLNHEIGGHEGR